jgi:chemotaxis-related protein WspD
VSDSRPCWQTIGVWGDVEPRCPELDRVIHCRNCEVFHRGGQRMFDREPPADYGIGWAEAIVQQRRDTRMQRVIVFRLAVEFFALTLQSLVRVVEWRGVRSVPHRRDETLLGLVNLEGELQLCVSLEALFDLPRFDVPAPSGRARMLVLGEGAPEFVVPVEEPVSLRDIALEELEAVPVTLGQSSSPYVRGLFTWRDQRVGLLDDELVLGALRRRLA